MNAASTGNMNLPGIDLPLQQESGLRTEGDDATWYEHALPLTVRERVMLDIMAALKNKTDWERKVFDDTIVEKWQNEAMSSPKLDISTSQTPNASAASENSHEIESDDDYPMNPPARQKVVTKKLFQYCIDELRHQAADSQMKGFTEVIDANATVYISDSNVDLETKAALRSGIALLEAVPENQKDWHPGSDGKVLDIVHPSLFPLMYGTSRYLKEGRVTLESCLEHIAVGETILSPGPLAPYSEYSVKHQWLPSEVSIGPNGQAQITSYINNLRPEGNQALYGAIEKVITEAIPLWKLTVKSTLYDYNHPRIIVEGDGYDADAVRQHEKEQRAESGREQQTELDCPDQDGQEEDSSDDEQDLWHRKNIIIPEPRRYEPRVRKMLDQEATTFNQTFSGNNLQVIVKLANIHLTPDKPTYDGGSWHIEGMPNEHICASALYYYDSSNVTDSYLAFRETVNEAYLTNLDDDDKFPPGPEYEQHRYYSLMEIYGLTDPESMDTALQVLGKVLTREGRLLVFPNVLQHRVLPFKLADENKPGHRKLLALFLVDPNIKIPSTANIPPQQRHWWAEQINKDGVLKKLPQELKDRVFDEVRDFPLDMEQAKRVREELMEERKIHRQEHEESWGELEYSFCEHYLLRE